MEQTLLCTPALAVIWAGVDVVDAHTLQKISEGCPEGPCSIAADLVRHPHPVGPLHQGVEGLLGCLVASCTAQMSPLTLSFTIIISCFR